DGMIEIIHAHDGMIDKFIGDNVMAVWGFAQAEGATKLGQRKSPHHNGVHRLSDSGKTDSLPALYYTADEKMNDAVKALDCAIAMIDAAQKYSFRGQPIRIGIGLNYGTVFCGNVGNDRKRQFTVLGHPVNLASRFESLTKELNVPIIVGESFYQQLPPERRCQFEVHRNVKVRGIDAVTCYGYVKAGEAVASP
ncbi:MAG: adenylate/guanylate cyclase domain-containing protein, partial [candidate division KSB1 bacterium]|nr:adenylate/guanylate cyclase domain-containing protein [candidate division KSB1 bacterium]